MKRILLILFLAFSVIGTSFAGGDDRDQELPLNSLNTANDEINSSLEEVNQQAISQDSENSTANLEELLKQIENDLKEISELEDKSSDRSFQATFKENYIDSFSGRFILLGVIALMLFIILLLSTFFSRK
jgi:predicted RND superfamily exporter protein